MTVATKRSALVMKVNGQMHSDAFERQLAFSFTVIILALKSFITKALEYKAVLRFKNNLYALLRILVNEQSTC